MTSNWKLCGLAAAIVSSWGQVAQAQEAASCRNVRFADVGWSDIAATTGLASVVLEGLGYKPSVTIASVPIAFAGIKARQIDAFLGYWNPSMTPMIEPFLKAPPDKTLSFVAEMDMGARRRPSRLRLPDAPGGGERRARQLPEVRDEAARAGGRRDDIRMPHASGGDEREA